MTKLIEQIKDLDAQIYAILKTIQDDNVKLSLVALHAKRELLTQNISEQIAEKPSLKNAGKYWSLADGKLVEKLHKEGKSDEEIGEKLGRTAVAIWAHRVWRQSTTDVDKHYRK